MRGRDWRVEVGSAGVAVRSDGLKAEVPPHARVIAEGVEVVVHRWPPVPMAAVGGDGEEDEFLRLVEMTCDRVRPEVVITPGGLQAGAILRRAKARGIKTARILGELDRCEAIAPGMVDLTIAPTEFAADYSRTAFGSPAVVLPPLRPDLRPIERREAGYVTFFDPTPARGVWFFARIADELGRSHPEIRLLVVEGRGTEADVAACGLDLRRHGNLGVMARPRERRDAWKQTRLALVPTLGWDGPPGAEAEALALGIPALVANRGGLPEVVGDSGVVLPIPDRITPATRALPSAAEVAPWVEAIIQFWDDPSLLDAQHERIGAAAARRWPTDLVDRYRRLFEGLVSNSFLPPAPPSRRNRSVVLVPHLHGIDWECEQGLRVLEQGGVRVVRRGGSSAIDAARNELASNALHDGFAAILFIDADIGFDPVDALRILARPEPVLCGIYAKKGERGLASHFAEGTGAVLFGPDAPGPYPVRFAATGFLMVKTWVLGRMVDQLDLPLCNTKWGRGVWPFFLPLIVPQDGGTLHYLGEDWAFSHRLGQVGITPMADTTIRLWHWGRHPFGWEDAGAGKPRFRSYNLRLDGS